MPLPLWERIDEHMRTIRAIAPTTPATEGPKQRYVRKDALPYFAFSYRRNTVPMERCEGILLPRFPRVTECILSICPQRPCSSIRRPFRAARSRPNRALHHPRATYTILLVSYRATVSLLLESLCLDELRHIGDSTHLVSLRSPSISDKPMRDSCFT